MEDRFVYNVEIRGIVLEACWDVGKPQSSVRTGSYSAFFDRDTEPLALVFAAHTLANTVDAMSEAMAAQENVPLNVYVQDPTALKQAYEEVYLLTRFFEHGKTATAFGRGLFSDNPMLEKSIDRLLVELDHAYVVGARTHEEIRSTLEEQAPVDGFYAGSIER